jgi:hypothetical protein
MTIMQDRWWAIPVLAGATVGVIAAVAIWLLRVQHIPPAERTALEQELAGVKGTNAGNVCPVGYIPPARAVPSLPETRSPNQPLQPGQSPQPAPTFQGSVADLLDQAVVLVLVPGEGHFGVQMATGRGFSGPLGILPA